MRLTVQKKDDLSKKGYTMTSYNLTKKQINWLAANLKDYSKMVKGTPNSVHIRDNEANFDRGAQIQIYIIMDREIVYYSLTRYGIESRMITENMELLGTMSTIHQSDSYTSGEPCFERLEFFLNIFLPEFLGIEN